MSESDLIPLKNLDQSRANPMIWENEEQPQGIFINAGDDDALALLGVPAMQLPPLARLPVDFEPGPQLLDRLEQLRQAIRDAATGRHIDQRIDMAELDQQSRQALHEMLGEGEVSGEVSLDGITYAITESVLTGIWRISGSDATEWLEVAPVPAVVTRAANSLRPAPVALPPALPGLMNGLPVLAEINEHAANWQEGSGPNRVLNFSLLPMSPQDQALLTDVLGRADLVLNSGGYGNCRVMATRVRHVWAVQYVNGMGHTILDTIEIGHVPDAAVAAREDFEDSAERLDEILEAYRL